MRPFHVSNLQLQPYSPFRVIVLSWVAKLLGVQFQLEGIPFGADRYHRPKEDRPALQCAGRSL